MIQPLIFLTLPQNFVLATDIYTNAIAQLHLALDYIRYEAYLKKMNIGQRALFLWVFVLLILIFLVIYLVRKK